MKAKEVFAWGVYDLANTAFSALFVTFFFPFYIKHFLGGNELHISLVFGLSMLFVGIIVPVIGALSDRIGKRMPFVIAFTIICCVFTWLVIYVDLFAALVFGFFANFFYHAALTTYNAIIPQIAKRKEYGLVSGIGVGMGYFGTLLSLGMAAIILNKLGWETIAGIKATFPATALFFLIIAGYTFFNLKDKKTRTKNNLAHDIKISFKNVWSVISNIKKHKGLIPMLLAMFMFVNAITAVIVFLFLYGRSEIGLSVQNFIWVYVLFSITAAFGSFAFGKITDLIGPKKALMLSGFLWIITIFALLLVKSLPTFIIAGAIGGIALGAVWTSMRPLLISLSPKKHLGQFFGFLELADKFSGVLGPIVFGLLVVAHSYTAGLISLLVFFIAGMIILRMVPDKHKIHS